jgi:hypothetical protein
LWPRLIFYCESIWNEPERPLYKILPTAQINCMIFENPLVWIGGGLLLCVILVAVVAPRFSNDARLERRRRKSNARIVSKTGKPTVRFSVRTKGKKRGD